MDRQDIDALLIGALYGELTPADEARLAAHLESHPGDRSALDGLKVARDAVQQSRIFDVQAEPPQAISAVLLQEAARRAPRSSKLADPDRRESWLFRFVRSFASHPAMAAAAMLVVVVGVAGTLYMRNGDQFAEKTAGPAPATAQTAQTDTERADEPAAVAVAAADAGIVENDKDIAAGAGSASAGYNVALADDGERKQEAADRQKKVAKAPAHESKKGYVEVTTPDRMPKEMDDKNAEVAKRDVAAGESLAGAGGAPPGAPVANMPETTAQATPPADYSRSKTATVAKPTAPTPAQGKFAEAPPPPPQTQPAPQAPAGPATNGPLLAWAKQTHAQVVALVKKGDCGSAAKLAAQVKTRAPDYFAQNMRDDRQLKSCMAYITDAADKEERAAPKKAAKATDTK
jgi:hypothetical protein